MTCTALNRMDYQNYASAMLLYVLLLVCHARCTHRQLRIVSSVRPDSHLPVLRQSTPAPRFDGRPADFAISRFTFYECSRCNRPFFGGARACRAANPELARAELVCGGCSVVTGADGDRCRLHDANFIEWKCK